MTAIVRLDLDDCPTCDAPLTDVTFDQPALLRHGGYGATQRTLLISCSACGWLLVAERGEVRP